MYRRTCVSHLQCITAPSPTSSVEKSRGCARYVKRRVYSSGVKKNCDGGQSRCHDWSFTTHHGRGHKAAHSNARTCASGLVGRGNRTISTRPESRAFHLFSTAHVSEIHLGSMGKDGRRNVPSAACRQTCWLWRVWWPSRLCQLQSSTQSQLCTPKADSVVIGVAYRTRTLSRCE